MNLNEARYDWEKIQLICAYRRKLRIWCHRLIQNRFGMRNKWSNGFLCFLHVWIYGCKAQTKWKILVTHRFWTRLIQLNSWNSVCPMVVSGFHCRWGPIFVAAASEKNSAIERNKKKMWKLECVFCIRIIDSKIQLRNMHRGNSLLLNDQGIHESWLALALNAKRQPSHTISFRSIVRYMYRYCYYCYYYLRQQANGTI